VRTVDEFRSCTRRLTGVTFRQAQVLCCSSGENESLAVQGTLSQRQYREGKEIGQAKVVIDTAEYAAGHDRTVRGRNGPVRGTVR
jgi:hypothetical protein